MVQNGGKLEKEEYRCYYERKSALGRLAENSIWCLAHNAFLSVYVRT